MAYVKTVWATGDVVTATKLNNAENGIEATAIVADAALPKAGGTMTGALIAPLGVDDVFAQNYKAFTALPSAYSKGETIFFINNQTGWPSAYGTAHTIKSYTAPAAIQFFYPYNTTSSIVLRIAAGSDAWGAWRTIWDSGNDGTGSGLDADTVDGLHFRVTAGVVEYSTDGSTWTAVGNLIDVTSLTPFNYSNNALAIAVTNTTILSITGKGLLNSAYITPLTAIDTTFRVIVDGVTIYENMSSVAAAPNGVISASDINNASATTIGLPSPAGSGALLSLSSSVYVPYPTTGSSTGAVSGAVILLEEPIYFHTSLLIQAVRATAGNISVMYKGASD